MGEFDFIPACVAIAKPKSRLGPSCRGPAVTGEQGNASGSAYNGACEQVSLRPPTLFLNIVDNTVSDLSQNWPI
jgi:hypothetical protein